MVNSRYSTTADFPKYVSFTITNACNLRCQMCGQWSKEGYMHRQKENRGREMKLSDWMRLTDEMISHDINSVLLRGGEVFLFPEIVGLLDYMNSKGIFISIDTNGTMLKKYARELLRIGNMHITFSVDGPEKIHDKVRGVEGSFKRLKENIDFLNGLEKNNSRKISKSITFTISPYSYRGLGVMPKVARNLSIDSIVIVPYYYIPDSIGKQYEKVLKEKFACTAFSWAGFHHETSGIDFNVFLKEYHRYLKNLNGMNEFPYMGSSKAGFSENDYRVWFGDPQSPVGSIYCMNVERLIDIQPDGNANFCVDFPDYVIGNVLESTISEIWNGEKAVHFREYRRKNQLPVCYRCGAKYMSEIPDKL